MPEWVSNSLILVLAIVLVVLNGLYVAAEFALVKTRIGRLEQFVREKRPFAKTALWLAQRMDDSLSACQLGITMASLALGWVAEPAFAELLHPVFVWMGINSESTMHVLTFLIVFAVITSLHLVIGEQAPKFYAIRYPERVTLWCAMPLYASYVILYPFLSLLSKVTNVILRQMGLDAGSGHNQPHTEEEFRALFIEAHRHGELTTNEREMLNKIFEFDDSICRHVMVPRGDVVFFDVDFSLSQCLALARQTKHTRYPVCEDSLDDVIGVAHIKDILGLDPDEKNFNIRKIMRPPRKVPETMPISRLLKEFQITRQLMKFVVDEYGTTVGIVTLQNVLEKIVGPVDDEFDNRQPEIVPSGPGQFIVRGSTPIADVERVLGLNLDDEDVDTVSGVLVARAHKLPAAGDIIHFDGAIAEVLEVKDEKAVKIRFTINEKSAANLD
jgi:CBS domain containing-hemolysin-like protein